MITRTFKALTSRPVFVLAALLALLALLAPVAFAESHNMVEYEENRTDPVANLQASDEDGGTISWSLKEYKDHALFEISSDGVLSFKSPPNFEDAEDVGGEFAGDNIYEVTVVANKGELPLFVTVTDLEEDGKVTLTQIQPQVEIQLTADLDDGDGGESSTTWQWARSSHMNTWTDIEAAKARSYTPAIADIDSYLRATASYTDRRGDGKTAYMVSERKVEAETSSNAAPKFPKEDSDEDDADETGVAANPFMRSVDENTKSDMAIGNPVGAIDDDDDEMLYDLGGTDAGHFDIDPRTGQLKVDMALDFEDAADLADADLTVGSGTVAEDDNVYHVTVTATDPSLANTEVHVLITVMDLNEAPTFAKYAPTADTPQTDNPTTVTVLESIAGIPTTGLDRDADTDNVEEPEYEATEADSIDGTRDTVTLEIEGADKDKFTFDTNNDGQLVFDDHMPDYEKQKEYSITIVAKDANAEAENRIPMSKSLDVTIKVTNREETGAVKLSQEQVQVGVAVTAMLTDPDGDETRVRWQWYEAEATGNDNDMCPEADADNTWEMIEGAKSATYTPSESHLDADDNGTLDDPECLRATAEYRDAIGEDNDSTADMDESLEMAHGTSTSDTPVEAKTTENKAPKFTKEDDDEDGTDEDGSMDAPFMRSVDENFKGDFGSALGVDDDDSALIWKLTGGDMDSFSIGRTDGQLSTDVKLNHEMQDMYMIEVTVTDPSQASGSAMVMIMVNNVDDKGVIAELDPDDYAENGDGPVASFEASDEDGGTISWSLKEYKDHTLFEISSDGELSFKSPPNFEDAKDVGGEFAGDNIYEVTVVANKGELPLFVTVTDLEEDGKVTLTQIQPQVEIQLTADLDDGDGGESSTTWQWARSSHMNTWTDIEAAKARSYTPAIADIDSYLRATASYTDRRGDGKTAYMVSERKVEAETSSNAAPKFPKEDSDEDDADETGVAANPFMRSVDENTKSDMAIGNPVGAIDDDDDEMLYDLGGTDAGHFDIDPRTGQLKVDMALDFEDADDLADADLTVGSGTVAEDDNVYHVTVTATDPSLANTEVHVLITVMDLNEAPTFAKYAPTADTPQTDNPTTVTVLERITGADAPELDRDAGTPDAQDPTYEATDSDELLTDPDDPNSTPVEDTVNLTIEGPDKDKFTFDADDTLIFDDHDPNYEKQKEYSIMIVAKDANAQAENRIPMTKRLDVTIKVTNEEEVGAVSLSQEQVQVGVAVTAMLVDPDGDETRVKWQWYEADAAEATGTDDCPTADDDAWEVIEGAKSATYTPGESHLDNDGNGTLDDPQCLRATAEYRDAIGEDDDSTAEMDESLETADGTSGTPVEAKTRENKQPKFTKEDDDEDGTDEDGSMAAPFMRNVDENHKGDFGSALGVDDDDSALIWKLTGGDMDSFSIHRTDGQLSTDVELDYETQEMYMIEVTVTDPSQASGSAMVMITVNNKDDKGVPILVTEEPANNAPEFDMATASFSVAENAAAGASVGMVMATDADDDDLTYSVDSMYFAVDSSSGEITTAMMLDHEAMSSHTVTVTASDDEASATIDRDRHGHQRERSADVRGGHGHERSGREYGGRRECRRPGNGHRRRRRRHADLHPERR